MGRIDPRSQGRGVQRGGPPLGAGEVEPDLEPGQPLPGCPPEERAGCCSLTRRQLRLHGASPQECRPRKSALDPPKENIPSEPAENTVQAGKYHDLPETQPRKHGATSQPETEVPTKASKYQHFPKKITESTDSTVQQPQHSVHDMPGNRKR